MINAYPSVMAVNRYQTHKDYYRVGAVSAVTGGKSNTIRRMLDLPYEQLAYKQFAQRAAKDVAGLVQSTETVKQSAQTLVNTTAYAPTKELQADITQNLQTFIHTYNELQDQLGDSPDYVSHALLQSLERAAKSGTLHDLGITKSDNGKLMLQPEVLEKQLNQPGGIHPKSLLDLTNFASSLVSRIDRLQQLPSVSLFQLSASPLKPFGQYQSQLEAYLPVPMRGILLDAKM
ncbi:hypothetical protein PAECIP111891_03443 [Paenibacillus allorhizoplanae]|uniref:Flagellar hook-associated protein 2 C-terminal domain-containing protein n=1 Tax=Paenibacillus allorhizoplanae TaxID=2905648 RepID=A0ABM9CBZ6_9BACL|nr:hypothetical protein [Paenibacillus allorhizoplanae]CAH1209926.1 hypothetical protein PAECIP111891_03443 [Paenibacillus allorhizoplanae]